MKVGDYVRLPDGIHKIKEYEYRPEYENCHCMYLDDNDYGLLFTDKELIKHSPNIIDLIEVGDLVYVDISPDNCGGIIVPRITETESELNSLKLSIENKDYVLKSIITHEQIESMEYKVKE